MYTIYKITNSINSKIYIGQTKNDLSHRWKQHLRVDHTKKPQPLYLAMFELGKEHFEINAIEYVETQEEADEKERYYISLYKSNDSTYGYNCDSGGHMGYHHNDETKLKIGEMTSQFWMDPIKAEKMKEGLKKATKKWQDKCEQNRINWSCPYCGEIIKIIPSEVNTKITCGKKECHDMHMSLNKEYFDELSNQNLILANEANKKIYLERKNISYEKILIWANENKNIINNCPKNKIKNTFQPLLDLLNIKDMRTLNKICEVKNNKEFLEWIKNKI